MDYEKKYNEALERARALWQEAIEKEYPNDYLKDYETIFPELRESEDERMMREFNDWLCEEIECRTNDLRDEKDRRTLNMLCYVLTKVKDWLEKQKENPKNAISIPSDCVSDAKCEDRWHKTANSLPDDGRDVLAKDALGNYLLASFDGAQWFVSVYDGQDHPVLHTPPILEWCEIPSEKQKEDKDELVYRLNGLMQDYIKEGEDDEEKEHRLKCYQLFWDALEDTNFFEQKEQKPNIELIQRSWYMEGYHDREFGKEPKWIIKTGEGGPKHELNPRYGQPLAEQRPTEEQLHNLNEAIKGLRMDGCERMADSLHSLYNILRTQEQKPSNFPAGFYYIDLNGNRYYSKEFRYGDMKLKVGEQKPLDTPSPSVIYTEQGEVLAEQKPAEWSEEDADMLNCCISSIEEAKENRYAYKETDGDTSYDREIAWLKSLRPDTFQNENSRPKTSDNWKPSEEQMKALQHAIDACESEWAYQDDELRSLLNDLKKL